MITATIQDVLAEQYLKEVQTSISAINDTTEYDENSDSMIFLNGGYTNIVLSMSLKTIKDYCKPEFTLRVINTFQLNDYFKLEDEIKELEEKIAENKQK